MGLAYNVPDVENIMTQWVVVEGNLEAGIRQIIQFDTHEEATQYGLDKGLTDWSVHPLAIPETNGPVQPPVATRTKLGLHFNGMSQFGAAFDVKPPIIKTLDPNVDLLRRYKQEVGGFVIARTKVNSQPVGTDSYQAIQLGKAFIEQNIWKLEAVKLGLVDAVETYNEPFDFNDSVKNPLQHEMYDVFQTAARAHLLDLCKERGIPDVETIAFNFGTGNGLGHNFLKYYPYTLEEFTYLGFHSYDWPCLFAMHDNDVNSGGEGMWLGLRYRRIMNEIRKEYLHHKVIITECGLTQGVTSGLPDIGWKSGNIPAIRYWEDSLLRYDSELQKDDYVMGAVVFDTGGDNGWETFTLVPEITDLMKEYNER